MNAKMKIIGDHCSHYWAYFTTILPLLLASILSAEMYLTHVRIQFSFRNLADISLQQHHASDIYCGIVLGLVSGTLAYRSVYAALFNPRFNHIPLPPFSSKTQLSYCQNCRGMVADGINLDQNTDKLVVWSWWRSGPCESAEGREKEQAWFRDIRQTTGVGNGGMSTGPVLPHNESDMFTMERVEERISATRSGSRSVSTAGSMVQVTSSHLSAPAACCV